MSKLISITVYSRDSTTYSPASGMAISSDAIKLVTNATAAQKSKFPAASGSINSVISINTELNNAGEDHTYYVGETLAAIVTASA